MALKAKSERKPEVPLSVNPRDFKMPNTHQAASCQEAKPRDHGAVGLPSKEGTTFELARTGLN